MVKILMIAATTMLVLHGLIHLMGTAVYMRLTTSNGFPYKTTLLGGRWDLGIGGMQVYGVLWGLAAIGFGIAAGAWLAGWTWWQPLLVGVALYSLALTILDWSNAFAGAVINIAILAMLWIGPRIADWFIP
jgi:hypothetical protein